VHCAEDSCGAIIGLSLWGWPENKITIFAEIGLTEQRSSSVSKPLLLCSLLANLKEKYMTALRY